MQQKNTIAHFFYKNAYLIIIAAWLITLSFLIDNYWSGNSSVENVHKRIEKYIWLQEGDFDKVSTDTSITNKLATSKITEQLLNKLVQKKYFFFYYTKSTSGEANLSFWNTQIVLPTKAIVDASDTIGFITLTNGFYVWKKTTTATHLSIALIPIKWNFFVKNEYLQNSFTIGDEIENAYDIETNKGVINVHSKMGKSLFYLKNNTASTIFTNNVFSVLLRFIAVLLLLFFINKVAVFTKNKYGFGIAISLLLLIILLLRYLSYQYPIPLNLRQFELFDPSIYSSNVILKSLGDLFINVLLLGWVSWFFVKHLKYKAINLSTEKSYKKWVVLSMCVIAYLLITFTSASIVRSMIADSQVSFDVINFFTLNFYSAIGFVVLCLIAIIYFTLTFAIVRIVKLYFLANSTPLYLFTAVFGLIYLTIKLNFYGNLFELFVLLWGLFYLLIVCTNVPNSNLGAISATKRIFWFFFFSVSITFLIVIENNRKELDKRKHYAEALANKSDTYSQTLMNTMLTDFRSDFLTKNFNRFKIETENKFLKDSLLNGNFSGYTNKYDTKIFLFDAEEKPLFNVDTIDINEVNAILTTQAKPTTVPDLYYYDMAYDKFSYIGKKVVLDTGSNILGYVYILANPKKNKPEALYPELFSKGKNNSIENSSLYSFAVYNNLHLVNNHNDYAFATKLTINDVLKEEFSVIKNKNYDELWYKANAQKVVVIARQNNWLIEAITLFSYIFCIFLLLTSLFWLVNNLISFGWRNLLSKQYFQVTIRSQIHGTIIFISVLSFLIIGVATILFFIKRYQNNNRERLSRTIHVMEKEVKTSLNDLAVFDDVVKIYDEGYVKKLQQTIEKISEIHAADINLYDLEGNLKVSSLPLPYNKGIVSTKMNPTAFYHLNKLNEIQYFSEENIGKLDFVSNYVPVLDEAGDAYAYLNIPYFTSQSELKKEISNFLVTIINLNAFIFLIAGIVALFITNRITRSFSFISDKMKQVNIGKANAFIEWKRKDEIGELINEYNKMVGKLDESAAALAKSEREGAWREMARQVAHEIKNPLTPMKLSLQYLQKAINNNATNVQALTASVAQTLVEQIEHLNEIAGEFGQFANIGNPKKEVFELNDVLITVLQLHSMADRVTIQFNPVQQSCKVEADKTQINRLFNNLILNAIQAQKENEKSTISIDEEIINQTIVVKIKDNGTGIPAEQHSKIFTPNFTTKTSGTGLGLAMCKGIVEQSNGKIWFETEENVGTTFFVELPVS